MNKNILTNPPSQIIKYLPHTAFKVLFNVLVHIASKVSYQTNVFK